MLNPYKGGKFKVTSVYGNRTLNGSTALHTGLDLVGLSSKELLAVCNGTVLQSRIVAKSSGDLTWQWGNYVMLQAETGERVIYAHLSKRLVSKGDKVKIGDVIGIEGNTGYSFGSHCHLEVRNGNNIVTSFVNTPSYTGIPNIIQTIKNKGVEEPMTAAEKKDFDALKNKVAELEKALAEKENAERVWHYWDELKKEAPWAYNPLMALYQNGLFKGASASDLNVTQTKLECLVIQARGLRAAGIITFKE